MEGTSGTGGSGGGAARSRVFLTSAAYDGKFSAATSGTTGLERADSLCQAAASGAGLPGTFKAWLSDSTTNAIDRLTDVGGWYAVGKSAFRIFESKAKITSGPEGGFTDEKGVGTSGEPWTGTTADGMKATMDSFAGTSANCKSWNVDTEDSGMTGEAGISAGAWTDKAAYQCQNSRPIYCFQQ